MRGSHAVNLRRVLSLPTARRETFLFGRYRPVTRKESPSDLSINDASPPKGPPARPRAARPGLEKSTRREDVKGRATTQKSVGNDFSNNIRCDDPPARYGGSAPTGSRGAFLLQSSQIADGKVSHSISGRMNASLDRSDIASSALPLMEGGTSHLSVEEVLDRQIRQNVFNLPVPRLRVWLYNMDIGTIAQVALRNLFSVTPSADKVLVAESVLANRVGSEDGVRSCRDAFLLLKLQRGLLSLGIRSELNLEVYRPCIQLLNFKIGSMHSEHVVQLCQTLAWLWHRMSLDGKLGVIRDCHGLKETDDLYASLYSPLVTCLGRAALDIGQDTVTRLLDLLVMLQHHLSKESLLRLHEISFLKVIEFSGALSLDAAISTLRALERLESNLPKPFYFICKEVLVKFGKSVHYKDFHLVVRCLSRCSSVDPQSLNRILLLYKSLVTDAESSKYYPLERFVVAVVLRALEIEPATNQANLELGGTYTPTSSKSTTELTPSSSCYITVPKGYHRKVHSLKDLDPLISWVIVKLKSSVDPSVPVMCDYSHIKRHYRLRGSLQLSLTNLLGSAAGPNSSELATYS
ncbi:SACPA operon antiterminator, putative [Babesia ovata]|uniref:SACPA operon antiterminator, putative n=1 Tax=Babesia ovata TaxID=189622 RepID=A0A2H6K911_9APIC|nr:SACPA operon antiterminator, putative [Babesia ovata]GBE59468.1 SACPA operon antiterminator, putative [Babesia ovata]